jgi:hypothetical protein
MMALCGAVGLKKFQEFRRLVIHAVAFAVSLGSELALSPGYQKFSWRMKLPAWFITMARYRLNHMT